MNQSAAAQVNPRVGRERLWTGEFIVLMVSAICMYISTFMLTPTLPLHVVKIGAGDLAAGGAIVAVYTLGSLLPRMFWGNLADRWRRQGVYLLGVGIIALMSPLFAVVVLPLIMGLRFLQGVGFSGSSTAAATISADLIPASRRAEGIGYYALANTLGMAIGPDLGLHMLQNHGSRWLFGSSFVIGAVSFALGLLITYERRKATTEPLMQAPVASGPPASRAAKIIEPSVLPISLVFLLVVLPYGAVMAFVAAYGLEQGVGRIGSYFTVFAAANFVVRLFVGRIVDRFGQTVVFVPAAVAMFTGLMVLYFADSLAIFLVSAAVFGLGFGISLPLLQAAAYDVAPAHRRGVASATIFATADIGYGLGAIILGFALDRIPQQVAFAGLAGFTVLCLVAFLTVVGPRLRARN